MSNLNPNDIEYYKNEIEKLKFRNNYLYINRDGKSVQARDLEDQLIEANNLLRDIKIQIASYLEYSEISDRIGKNELIEIYEKIKV
jgi:hypothetical protein